MRIERGTNEDLIEEITGKEWDMEVEEGRGSEDDGQFSCFDFWCEFRA